jgi:hypothetical protein
VRNAGSRLLDISFITIIKPNLCTAVTTQNTTQKNYIISHPKNMAALQPDVFLNGTALPSANNCQSQLQTPQSVTVLVYSFK